MEVKKLRFREVKILPHIPQSRAVESRLEVRAVFCQKLCFPTTLPDILQSRCSIPGDLSFVS